MATVVRKGQNEPEESLIARFRKKVYNEQILIELKEREYYKPPAVKKKEKLASQKRNRRKRR